MKKSSLASLACPACRAGLILQADLPDPVEIGSLHCPACQKDYPIIQGIPHFIQAAELNPDTTMVFDVRREADYTASGESIPGAIWKNPEKIDAWIEAMPGTQDVVIYCVRGGSVSNSVVDHLQPAGVKAHLSKVGSRPGKPRAARSYTNEMGHPRASQDRPTVSPGN